MYPIKQAIHSFCISHHTKEETITTFNGSNEYTNHHYVIFEFPEIELLYYVYKSVVNPVLSLVTVNSIHVKVCMETHNMNTNYCEMKQVNDLNVTLESVSGRSTLSLSTEIFPNESIIKLYKHLFNALPYITNQNNEIVYEAGNI